MLNIYLVGQKKSMAELHYNNLIYFVLVNETLRLFHV